MKSQLKCLRGSGSSLELALRSKLQGTSTTSLQALQQACCKLPPPSPPKLCVSSKGLQQALWSFGKLRMIFGTVPIKLQLCPHHWAFQWGKQVHLKFAPRTDDRELLQGACWYGSYEKIDTNQKDLYYPPEDLLGSILYLRCRGWLVL